MIKPLAYKKEDFEIDGFLNMYRTPREAAEMAQKLFDDWLISLIEEMMSYNVGVSLLSEEAFKEIRDWYNE